MAKINKYKPQPIYTISIKDGISDNKKPDAKRFTVPEINSIVILLFIIVIMQILIIRQ